MDDFFAIAGFIRDMLAQERPSRILELSGGGNEFGYMLRALQEHYGISGGVVDRIEISGGANISASAYGEILSAECLDNPHMIGGYDFVLILDLLGETQPEKIRALLDVLQNKVTRQILLITPLDSSAGYRKYHPVVFTGLDYSYSMIPGVSTPVQAYSIFHKIKYSTPPIDRIPTLDSAQKMNIAFALPHHGLTGGMKALLQQIRWLTRRGHNVTAYFRSDTAESAIPPWSDLTDDDCSRQVVIPTSERFIEYMRGMDVVVLGFINQAIEFATSGIPAVLWEQGSEAMYGDFGKAVYSQSAERFGRHGLYLLPLHLLAVSDVIGTVLKGIYNRESFVYPNGIDTQFYHPAEKDNDVPVVLLTGNPSLAFKGFNFAFEVLRRAYAEGARFRVRWAAQVQVIHGETNFPLEVVVNPPQHELAEMYRSADVFLSTSLYESYPLPPLEAMASGTAVIATDCGGIRTYAKNGENCVLCRQGDHAAVVDALKRLLDLPHERERLARAGRETALQHSAEQVIPALERRLYSIVQCDGHCRTQLKIESARS